MLKPLQMANKEKPGIVDGGFIGHAINQAMSETTNQSSYRYPRIIEKVGNVAAGKPTPGSTATNLMPNNIVGSLSHWMIPKTTNALKDNLFNTNEIYT